MRTVEQTEQEARNLVGKRVEIPVHYEMWMRGARFGVVTGWHKSRAGLSACVLVKLDHPQARRRVKVWATDFDYIKQI